MKLPNLRQTYEEARSTVRRFPLVMLDAAVGTAAALILVDYEGPAGPTVFFKILLAAILGLPLLIALAVTAEKRGSSRPTQMALQGIGVLLLLVYGSTVPADLMHAPSEAIFRFFILCAALVLLLAFMPFASRGEWNGFWQYNKTLFLRILTAMLYAAVLYAGLAIALAALDNLFGIHVPGKRYFELWILIVGIFTTWFFLAGIPDDLRKLETLSDYPKTLKVLAQYILLPVVLVYLVILYAYLGKIVIAWDWPQGWVSKLILGFSGAGIFLVLLLYPIREQAGNLWVKNFSRWFYVVLIPLIVMLFLAVSRRVGEYGMTEGRYLAIVLGVWLAFLVVYTLTSRVKSIKAIPVSLCILAFLVSFGPWGAFAVARRSQVARLERIAGEAGILVNGKVHPAQQSVPVSKTKEMSAILAYLHEVHGFAGIQPWFDTSLRDSSLSEDAYKDPEAVAKLMGIEFASRWAAPESAPVNFSSENAFALAGYDRAVIIHGMGLGGRSYEVQADDISYRMSRDMDTLTCLSRRSGETLAQIDLRTHAAALMQKYVNSPTGRIPCEEMAIGAEGRGIRVRVCPSWLHIEQRQGKPRLSGMTAVVIYTLERRM